MIGFLELIGSWLLILGLLTPLATLAMTGTMATAAYQHILTAGLSSYVLELVVLHLGGSLALLFNGPGRFSFEAGMGSELISGLDQGGAAPETDQPGGFGALTTAVIQVKALRQAD
ncbi:MAG: hypothetical protein R6W06_02020 [Prochlorococcaceae cyanobacterium]